MAILAMSLTPARCPCPVNCGMAILAMSYTGKMPVPRLALFYRCVAWLNYDQSRTEYLQTSG